MRFFPLPLHRRAWALSLVLAMLWLGGWGQMHRVLHAGAAAVAQATPVEASWQAGLVSHEDGGSLCQLLDQLSHGSALGSAAVVLAAAPPPVGQLLAPALAVRATAAPVFDARGPPFLA